jgi:DDE superfamily endonuclease
MYTFPPLATEQGVVGLDTRELSYVVDVRSATSAYAEQVRPTTAPYTGKGRRPRPRYHDKPSSPASLALKPGSRPVWS